MCGSRWWKTSSASARPPAVSAASLKAASKRCTTWFLSPTGARHDPEKWHPGFRIRSCLGYSLFSGRFLSVMVAPLKVGIAGLGTVGAEVVRLIERQGGILSARSGRGVRVVAVTARSKAKKRGLDLRDVAWAKNALALAGDPGI